MRKIFLSILLIIILAGCSNDDIYNNSIQKGLDYIASEEYQKAEGAFESALDEKPEDEKATALLGQTVNYQEGLEELDDEELDTAKEKFIEVVNQKNGASSLIKKAEDQIESINESEEKLAKITEEYEEALKLFENKEYEKSEEKINNLLEKDLEAAIFKSMVEKIEKLKEDVDSKLTENKQEETEANNEKDDKETATEEKPEKYDLELNPSQEGFYDGERYSGDSGMAGPDETHTVEDARAMGYDVIPITRHPKYGTPMIEGLNKPYPYDRWEEDYEGGEHGFTHIEGKLYEFQGEQVEFVHTEIMEHKDEYRAVFLIGDDYLDFGF